MKPLPALAFPRHQICAFENRKVLGDCLTGHIQPLAQVSQRLPISLAQAVKELSTACICQGLKNSVMFHLYKREPLSSLWIDNM